MSAGIDRQIAAHLRVPDVSGIVTATSGKLKRLFCLEHGALAHVASNVVEEQPGHALVASGLIDEIVRERAEAEVRANGQKLSATLVASGAIAPARLREALESQARGLLFATLDWGRGEIAFTPGRARLGGELLLSLPSAALLVDYARERPVRSDAVRQRIGSPTDRFVTNSDLEPPPALGVFGPTAKRLLTRATKAATLSELLADAGGESEAALRAVYASILLGLLGLATTVHDVGKRELGAVTLDEVVARLKRAEGADHYQTLELGPTATQDDVRAAYYFLARRYHPDRFRTGPLVNLLPEIETYFAQVTQAYNTLWDTESRAELDRQRAENLPTEAEEEQDAAYVARENYAHARILMGRGRYVDASTFLENAVKLDGGRAEYRLELARVLLRNPRRRADTRMHLLEAIRLEPARAEAYLVLGQLDRLVGQPDAAAENFREALRWDPDNAEALRELSDLTAGGARR